MKDANLKRAMQLAAAMGVSGEENDVRKIMIHAFGNDHLCSDRLGSLFCIKETKSKDAPTLMIATNLDEPGLMIDEILSDGRLSFVALEDLSPASLLHQRVQIWTRSHKCRYGIISCSHTKFMEEAKSSVSLSELTIETGMSQKEAEEIFHIGDLALIDGEPMMLNDHMITGKALYNRILLEAILEIRETLLKDTLDYRIAFGGIAQSAIGWRGTKTATYVIRPDAALVLTGFEINASDPEIHFGDGTICEYYDKQMLPSRMLLNDFTKNVKTVPYFGYYGNDGSFIHKTIKGTPSLAVGIGMKNIGTNAVIADLNDIDTLVKNVAAYCRKLNAAQIRKFQFEAEHEH